MDTKPDSVTKLCSKCDVEKFIVLFIKNKNTCKDCNNKLRREKYKSDEKHRQHLIDAATEYKKKRSIERNKEKELTIGIGNKKCSFCSEIKPIDNFRHNRLKCKVCERDDPKEKLKRVIRSRIYIALQKNKSKKTIEYLGCNQDDYVKWISYNSCDYTIDNHGKLWHIDHVIPLSKFNLDDEVEQLIAFNWRNTTAVSVKENLSKNNKILTSQIEEHLNRIKIYHNENKIDLPQSFVNLFAKYLVAGTPLEPSLPLCSRNVMEELG
jgi:hypothetical protein